MGRQGVTDARAKPPRLADRRGGGDQGVAAVGGPLGGSAVDPGAYRWKGGIGDRDLRVPFPNTNWGRIDSNDVGIGEFCQFCELVNAEPLVCVSFSDGAESAADLVEYCNGSVDTTWGARRAADGRPEPYRVKYWQLGNELGGDDSSYISKCKSFIAAMKKVDPGIAIISSFPSQKVFEVLGKDLSHLAPHHYTRDLAACEADFRKLSKMISSTPGCGHLRLAVTEWNFTAGDWGLMPRQDAHPGRGALERPIPQLDVPPFRRRGDGLSI